MKTIKEYSFTISISFAIVIILFFTQSTAKLTEFKITAERNYISFKNSIEKHSGKISKLENDNIDVKVRLAKIETKLTNIQAMLLDISERLRRNGK